MQERIDSKGNFMPSMFTKVALALSTSLRLYVNQCASRVDTYEAYWKETQDHNKGLQIELTKKCIELSDCNTLCSWLVVEHAKEVSHLYAQMPNVVKAAQVQKRDILNMPFKLGTIEGFVYGGPFKQRPDEISVGVKMAKEIKKDCEIDIPTVDFSVPDVAEFKLGLLEGILHLAKHGELYVGCMGGIGRTGLYMAGLAKIMELSGNLEDGAGREGLKIPRSIQYVRTTYKAHAVETDEQINYIKNLDVSGIISALRSGDIIV